MAYAEIHEFLPTNTTILDVDGEPMLGFYYSIVEDGKTSPMMGPYVTAKEAERESKRAFSRGDY